MILALVLIFKVKKMKSSYIILCAKLDGAPVTKNISIKPVSSYSDTLFPISMELNLFDFPHCKRVMNGFTLLLDDFQEIVNKIKFLKVLEELIIKIDFFSENKIINDIYFKRVLQAIAVIQLNCPNITYTIVAEEDKYIKVKKICNKIQKLA